MQLTLNVVFIIMREKTDMGNYTYFSLNLNLLLDFILLSFKSVLFFPFLFYHTSEIDIDPICVIVYSCIFTRFDLPH